MIVLSGLLVLSAPSLSVIPAKAGTQYAAVYREGTAYWIPGLPPIKSGVARDDS